MSKSDKLANDLDSIVPKYLLMQLMESSTSEKKEKALRHTAEQHLDHMEHLRAQSKDEH